MKTKKVIFILFIVALSGIFTIGKSQDSRQARKERKEVEKAMITNNYYSLDSVLVSRRYVLEADFLENKTGNRISVSSILNFIKVEDDKGLLQTGSDMNVGSNGFGGVTTEGNISKYEVQRNLKSLTYRVSFNLVTSLGIFNIDMTIRSDNSASATITSTSSGRLTWHGHLATLYNSRTFKGMDVY